MRLMSSRAPQRGASLIEVLVAILIVSMGVIAMGGLLASSSRLGKASESRAIAGLLAADLADRVKANACGLTGQWIDPANASVHCAGIARAALATRIEDDCGALLPGDRAGGRHVEHFLPCA